MLFFDRYVFQTLSHYEVANARRRAPRKGVPSTRQKCEVAGALCFFCTNATSGIMRGRHLTCESRVLPCPSGSAEWQKGETREEGGHALRGVRTQQVKKALQTECFLCVFIRSYRSVKLSNKKPDHVGFFVF